MENVLGGEMDQINHTNGFTTTKHFSEPKTLVRVSYVVVWSLVHRLLLDSTAKTVQNGF